MSTVYYLQTHARIKKGAACLFFRSQAMVQTTAFTTKNEATIVLLWNGFTQVDYKAAPNSLIDRCATASRDLITKNRKTYLPPNQEDFPTLKRRWPQRRRAPQSAAIKIDNQMVCWQTIGVLWWWWCNRRAARAAPLLHCFQSQTPPHERSRKRPSPTMGR